ncbi:glycosyl hydrolase [Acidobacteriota bacterium]
MKKTSVVLMMALILAGCRGTETRNGELAAGFKNPGRQARPRAYWNWLNGAVTLEGLTRDLEEAKDKGLIGLEMWDTEAMRNPGGFVPAGPPFMGPESVAFMHHAMKEAKRLGLDLGLITSSGWNAGGPWIPPELASKNLFVSCVIINGPGRITQKLPFPEVPRLCPRGEDGLPEWYQDVAVLAWPDSEDKVIGDPSKVIDITDRYQNGELKWEAPAGRWRIERFVCSNNGQQLIAASPNSKGPFIDFLDPEATRFHFEYIIGKLGLTKGGDPESPLKYLEVDSMELHEGIQWTPRFPGWFNKHHEYDPVAWLPVLTGWTIKDKVASDRFQYDYKKTVSDLLIFSHYTTGSEVCADYGLELAGEAGGPGPPIWDSCPVDALKALGNVAIPRGEFWIKNRNNIFLVKEIASAAHIYGNPYVDAESWTTWRRWKDSPFVRKQIVDRAFCEGLNRITYHGYSHSPVEAGNPGRSYHAGVDMNPQVAWWSKARPFMDYLARCCHMLQQGLFVADVAYYYGDKAPNFWPAFANVPEKPPLDGLGAGFDYDVVNSDVIVNRMSVKDGRIVFPDGMSYSVLVLPDQRDMQLEVLVRLEELVAQGATIIGPKPLDVPGMRDHESRGEKLRALADRMWGPCNGTSVKQNSYGKGRIVWGLTPQQWLTQESIGPDFSCRTAEYQTQLDYIHRQTKDTDIYFVRNKSLLPVSADCLFRVKDRPPQLWDPADGGMEPMFVYRKVDEGTRVHIALPPGGSVFVVFDKNHSSGSIDSVIRTPEMSDASLPAWQAVEMGKTSVTIQCWQNGQYTLTDNSGRETRFTVDVVPTPLILAGVWKVEFDPKWGAPARIDMLELISWTDHEDQGVKHYSGAGIYTRGLNLSCDWLGDGRRIHLDLGNVRELAEVFVNGKSAGVLWKAPFRADITALVKPGVNKLKIEVMNMWINRLAGDQDLPAEKKFTRTNITFDGYRGQPGTWQVQPAGLLGPVRLLPSVDVKLDINGRGKNEKE